MLSFNASLNAHARAHVRVSDLDTDIGGAEMDDFFGTKAVSREVVQRADAVNGAQSTPAPAPAPEPVTPTSDKYVFQRFFHVQCKFILL